MVAVPRTVSTMNEHGSVEISVCEHLSDVAEVTSNLIAAVRILNVVGANVDRPAVVTQFEMMGGLLGQNPITWSPCMFTVV